MIFMKKNTRLKYIIYACIAIILFAISFFLFNKSVNNYTRDVVKYDEVSSIDYKVYLKENSYFDTPFLGEDKVYITSLIDYIDVDFSYNLKLDAPRTGKYIYNIKGIISANISNTDKDYWSKTYDLVKPKEITYNNTDNLSFNENIKIDYQAYNDILLQFKEDYKLSMDGNFKIILCVENFIESKTDSELTQITSSNLEIPLTKATIEVPIGIKEVNRADELASELIYNDSIINVIYKILSIISLLFGLYLIVLSVFKIVRSLEKISSYNKELRKILKTYDGIIVNVNSLPSYNSTSIIDVNSFSELLDAHSEIRQPISYFESRKKATFILINGNIVWRYILKDNEYEK